MSGLKGCHSGRATAAAAGAPQPVGPQVLGAGRSNPMVTCFICASNSNTCQPCLETSRWLWRSMHKLCLWTSGRAGSSAAPPTTACGPSCCTTQYGTGCSIGTQAHKLREQAPMHSWQRLRALVPRPPFVQHARGPKWRAARNLVAPQTAPPWPGASKPSNGPHHAAVDSSNVVNIRLQQPRNSTNHLNIRCQVGRVLPPDMSRVHPALGRQVVEGSDHPSAGGQHKHANWQR